MAIKKSLIYNTIGAVGVVAVPTGITLGVVYGTTVADPHLVHKKAVSTGAKMFDKEIAGATSDYASTAIINPEHGIDLSELVRLDKNMDSAGARKMIALDDNGDSTGSVWSKTIDMQNMSSGDANKALEDANKEIAVYKTTGAGKGKNLGIYIGKDINVRHIIISLYEVRSIDKDVVPEADVKYMNDFIDDIGGIDGSNINPSSTKQFFEMFAGEMGISMDDVTSYYHFGEGSKLVAGNTGSASDKAAAFIKAFANKYPQAIQDASDESVKVSETAQVRHPNSSDDQYIKDLNGDIVKGPNGKPILKMPYAKPYRLKNPDGQDKNPHLYFQGLAKRNLFLTVKPVIDWNAGQIKLVMRYSLLDKSNKESYLDYTTKADYVHNALATKTVVKTFSLATIVGDGGKSKIIVDSPEEMQKKYELFRQAIVGKTLSKEIPVDGKEEVKGSFKHFISRSIVQPGLLMLGKVMPSLSTRTTGLVNVVNMANTAGVNLANTFTDDYIKGLFEKLEDDPTVNAKEWFDENIVKFSKDEGDEAFKDDNKFYWSSLTSLLALGPKPFIAGQPNNDGEGGQYRMFSMFSGWGVISDDIMEHVKHMNPGVALLASSNLIDNLFTTLKEQSIIPETLSINKLIGNPFKYVKEILLNIYNKGLSLSDTEINDIVHAIPVAFISESKTHREQIAKLIEGLLKEPKTIKALFDIASGDKTPAQFLDQIFKDDKFNLDNLLNLIPTIIGQKNINTQTLKDLGKIILDSGVVATGVDALPASVDEAGKAKISGLIEEILQDPSKLVDNVLEAIPVSFIQSNKAAIASIINDLLSTPEMRKKFVSFITGGKTVSDLYHTISEGGFSVANLMKQIPVILGNQKVDTDFIDTLFKAIEDSGLLPVAVSKIVNTVIHPGTQAFKQVIATLFRNGALTHIYEEVMNIMKTGVQGQLDTPEHTAASTARYATLFDEFKEPFPAINGVHSDKAMAAVADILKNGLGLTDDSLDSVLDIVKAIVPQAMLDKIHFDQIAPIVKLLKDKAISDLTVPELKQIFTAVGEFVPAIKTMDQDALASIVNHLTNSGYDKFDDFKADLLKVVPDSIKNFKVDLGFFLGSLTFNKLIQDIKTRDSIKLMMGKDVTEVLNDIVMHGITSDRVSKALFSVGDLNFWGTIKGFMPVDMANIAQKLIDAKDEMGKLVGAITKSPILDITGDEVDSALKLVNLVLGKTLPTDIGEPLISLLNNAMFSSLSSVDSGLKAITELVKSLAGFDIPDSIMNIIDEIIPVLLIGNDGVNAQSANAVKGFAAMAPKVAEVKLLTGAIMPSKYDGKTYSDLKAKYDSDEQKAKVGNPFEIDNALVDAKATEAKIIAYNDEITKVNEAWTKLSDARTSFVNKYKDADAKIVAMNAIADPAQKILANAYNAISGELKTIYKTDVSALSVDEINKLIDRINKIEPEVAKINLNIASLNGDSTFDITPLTNEITNLGITVKGLSPIDPDVFKTFKAAFDAASDDKELDKAGFTPKPCWSLKAQTLAEFIDVNKDKIFGDKWPYPDFLKLGSMGKFSHSFKELAKSGSLGYTMHRSDSSITFDLSGYIDAILKKVLSQDDFDNLQKYVLTPLGL